jgi:hypothetical protein
MIGTHHLAFVENNWNWIVSDGQRGENCLQFYSFQRGVGSETHILLLPSVEERSSILKVGMHGEEWDIFCRGVWTS